MGSDELDLRAGLTRYNSLLTISTTIVLFAWTLISGHPFDRWVIGILAFNVVGSVVAYYSDPMSAASTSSASPVFAGFIIAAYMPFYGTHQGMLLFPALAAVATGAAFGLRLAAVEMAPPAIVLAWVVARTDGTRQGVATAVLVFGLWVGIGAVGQWLRNRLAKAGEALLAGQQADAERAAEEAQQRDEAARQAERELRRRLELAGRLRGEVATINGATSEMEQQAQSIAVSVELLAESLRLTSDTATETATAVSDIGGDAEDGRSIIDQLGEAGREIVGIVDTITELSEQTNLLALNATIEAERAGPSGKGFAVVANEVKELAKRTAESAGEIASMVETVQDRVGASGAAMTSIADKLAAIEGAHTTLNDSVAQQANTVDDIAGSAATSAGHVARIGESIRRLDDSARHLTADQGDQGAHGGGEGAGTVAGDGGPGEDTIHSETPRRATSPPAPATVG